MNAEEISPRKEPVYAHPFGLMLCKDSLRQKGIMGNHFQAQTARFFCEGLPNFAKAQNAQRAPLDSKHRHPGLELPAACVHTRVIATDIARQGKHKGKRMFRNFVEA